MKYNNHNFTPYPLGVTPQGSNIKVSYISNTDTCGIILYDKKSGHEIRRISFDGWNRMGKIRYGLIENVSINEVTYQFYDGEDLIPDPYGKAFISQGIYGQKKEEQSLKSMVLKEEYDWEDDVFPRIPYENAVCYCMHVRGFTKHASSGVRNKGTFRGVVEKLDYLKELGITTVEMQPIYEFMELEGVKQKVEARQSPLLQPTAAVKEVLNYWGYKKGFYYAPKACYASFDDPVGEFRELVKAFHKHQMEVILQFYFPNEVSKNEIIDILRYWVLAYHVDGFRLMGENLPFHMIATDQGLADTKLWFEHVDADWLDTQSSHNLAVYRDDYMYDMRRFLKGDHDMLQAVCYQMRRNPSTYGKINYFTNYYGLTMMDMVSYNDKHNEENGEDNLDGSNYNQSWNCGVEGPSRKRQIVALRKKQYKNAMSMLFLSQGTPLIFMGDEFGNSQMGNNNPYCQDNEITWLDWKCLGKNRELYEFTAQMIAFRKAHPILRQAREPRLMDYLAYGYPDLSYHGAEAFRPSMSSLVRQIGMMYCGRYAKVDKVREDDSLYIALNMHWEAKELALPRLPGDLRWELAFVTEETEGLLKKSAPELKSKENALVKKIPPRSVAVFISREIRENE
ncbi:MAG: hypothetical protein IKV27_07630 [Lachnospiraceae bacterium]|nr:hypothetical protein [Lachnospiraceae bacterium]